jgi:predicted transposase YdaD
VQERHGPRPFDVATRGLIEVDPAGWLRWLGLPVDGPVQPIESDISTALAAVDKVLRVDGPSPWLAHLELQVSRDRLLPSRLLQYHALLLHRHQLPVATTVVILRTEAHGPELSGQFEHPGPSGETTVRFNYTTVRLWERPAEELLAGGLGIAPLAPLADMASTSLPTVLDRLDVRFEREAPTPSDTDELWAATLLLMGVRYTREQIRGLSERVQRMRESVTYQMIVEEGIERGEVSGMRRLIVDLGTEKFGPPDALTIARLDRVASLERLRQLGRAILHADSWDDLLASVPAL